MKRAEDVAALGPIFGALLMCALVAWFAIGERARRRERAERESAKAQVGRIADELDGRTTPTGSYVRAESSEFTDTDPWGRRLEIHYSEGGVAESLTVRSAGPDGLSHNGDDVVATRMVANFKGLGRGIKDNIQETGANAARGVVKGAIEGVREAFQGEPDSANATPDSGVPVVLGLEPSATAVAPDPPASAPSVAAAAPAGEPEPKVEAVSEPAAATSPETLSADESTTETKGGMRGTLRGAASAVKGAIARLRKSDTNATTSDADPETTVSLHP